MNDLQSMLQDINREARLTRYNTGKEMLDSRVMQAMRQVPRQHFIPAKWLDRAYLNGPVPIGCQQTISQPYIVALMSDLLNTKPSDRILEIGTGSGYQAAVLSCLVEQVYSIEIIDTLAEAADKRLKKLGYTNISLSTGDGYFGWPEQAPFDGIIVTAAALHIPPPWIEQLKTNARIIIPIGLPYSDQELMVIEKKPDGKIKTQSILGVSFVPLVGKESASISN